MHTRRCILFCRILLIGAVRTALQICTTFAQPCSRTAGMRARSIHSVLGDPSSELVGDSAIAGRRLAIAAWSSGFTALISGLAHRRTAVGVVARTFLRRRERAEGDAKEAISDCNEDGRPAEGSGAGVSEAAGRGGGGTGTTGTGTGGGRTKGGGTGGGSGPSAGGGRAGAGVERMGAGVGGVGAGVGEAMPLPLAPSSTRVGVGASAEYKFARES